MTKLISPSSDHNQKHYLLTLLKCSRSENIHSRMNIPVTSACVWMNNSFLLRPPQRNRVSIECPALFKHSTIWRVPCWWEQTTGKQQFTTLHCDKQVPYNFCRNRERKKGEFFYQ